MRQSFLDSTHHNVAWLNKRNQDNELEIRPAFQRRLVWTEKQQAFLIDTILRGYPIPELYMQEFTDELGQDRYVVVDGQQRIRACLDFLAGKFPLDAEDSPDFGDMFFEDLSAEQKKIIFNYNFVVRKLPEMPEQELRLMFMRLNKNVMSLNKQELRHATYWGRFIKTCEDISDDDLWSTFGLFTPNDFRRMIDVEYVSELVVAFLHGPQNKKANLDRFFEAYEQEFSREREVRSAFKKALQEIHSILPDLERSRWRKKSDFYTLFLAFAERHSLLPFASDVRATLSRALMDFAAAVDAFVTDVDGTGKHAKDIRLYGNAVERAASDLANRRDRKKVIDDLFSAALGSKAA